MKKYTTMALCSFLLTGCSNMGSQSRTIQHIYNTEIVNNENITIQESKQHTLACPIYIPLSSTAAPDIPILKVRQAADKSDHEVVVELTKYIRDLREYIAKQKKDEKLHYQKYLDSCLAEVK